MKKLFEIQHIVIQEFEKRKFYWRSIFDDISIDGNMVGIVGSRGVGKTTFLIKSAIDKGAKKKRALYVSLDNIFFLENKLMDLVDYLYKNTEVNFLFLDEVHKYPNWRQELKNINDTYPSINIVFSGSSMIDLVKGKYDLSRRVLLNEIYGFSFREYLEFYLGKKIKKFNLKDIVFRHEDILEEIGVEKILKHFQNYLEIGYYPFFKMFVKQENKAKALENIVSMTIYEDIGKFHSFKTEACSVMENLFKFIINSSAGELNAYKLAKTLNKDFETISNYLKCLKEAGLIRFIYSKKSGKSFLKNPIKMYPDNTNMIHAAYLFLLEDQKKGKIRETFVLNQLQNIKKEVFYSKEGDFQVGDFIFEVGGRNKKIKKDKNYFVLADDIVVGGLNVIPLYLFGFLY